jgi:N6-adenosine-specific RNA methylase IME4
MSGASYQRGARVLAEGSPELVARFERGQETVNSAFRKLQAEQQRQENRELARWLREHPPPWPEGRWSVLVIDPPWPLECALPYPTMSLEEIAAVPVADLVAEDAIVWLWTTNSFLLKAGAIGEGWGLRYDTKLEWIKDKLGTGQTLRGQSEPCLVFKRGRPLIDLTTESTVLSAAVREHSRKPAEFYEQVETLCPGNKLELFAREARPGWDRWGAEPDKYPGLEGK